MAFIDREVTRAQSTRANSCPTASPNDPTDGSDTMVGRPSTLRKTSQGSSATTYGASEHAQERSIAEMLSGSPVDGSQAFHGQHPGMDGRQSRSMFQPTEIMRDGPRSGTPEVVRQAVDGVARHFSQEAQVEGDFFGDTISEDEMPAEHGELRVHSLSGQRERIPAVPPRSPRRPLSGYQLYVVNPDQSSSHRTEDSHIAVKHTQHDTSEAEHYFGSAIPQDADDIPLHNLIRSNRREPTCSPSQESIELPVGFSPYYHRQEESTIHPAYRRYTVAPRTTTYPRPLERLPSPRPSKLPLAVQAHPSNPPGHTQPPVQQLPKPSTHATRHPHRWYVALYNYLTEQPRGYPPDQTGAEFSTNLQHGIAPSHWLLRGIQVILWSAILIYCFIRVANVGSETGRKLAFECFEIRTQLRLVDELVKSSSTVDANGNPSTSVAVANPLESVPKEFFAPHSLCLLSPMNGAVFLANDFCTLLLLGVTSCGVAVMVEALWYRVCKKVMERSGAYGIMTLGLRVLGQVLSCFTGVGVVVGISWFAARRS